MALGDPIITSNIVSGTFFEQPGTTTTETLNGWDTIERSWLTHPDTPRSSYPVKGDADGTFPYMRITDVQAMREESGLKLISANYRGVIRTNGGSVTKPHYLVPGVATQMVSLPALTGGGSSQKRTLIVPVPMPTLTRSHLVIEQPTFDVVGNSVTADFLPPPGSWNISYLPDPDVTLPTNYYTGWVLMERTWDTTQDVVWLVTEVYHWFWAIS